MHRPAPEVGTCRGVLQFGSQLLELFNACHLLFYVESVSAAYNQEPSLIFKDHDLQFTDKEVELWVRGHKPKSPLLENSCIKKQLSRLVKAGPRPLVPKQSVTLVEFPHQFLF